jgi:hypothetical protein
MHQNDKHPPLYHTPMNQFSHASSSLYRTKQNKNLNKYFTIRQYLPRNLLRLFVLKQWRPYTQHLHQHL